MKAKFVTFQEDLRRLGGVEESHCQLAQ